MTDDSQKVCTGNGSVSMSWSKNHIVAWFRGLAISGALAGVTFAASPFVRAETSVHRLERKLGKFSKRAARTTLQAGTVVLEGAGVVGALAVAGCLEALASSDEETP